ncbi:hypothetical protein ACUXPL_001705 [Micrococcus sp. 140720015-1]
MRGALRRLGAGRRGSRGRAPGGRSGRHEAVQRPAPPTAESLRPALRGPRSAATSGGREQSGAPRSSRPAGSGTDGRASAGPRRRMLGGRRWRSSGASRETAGDGRRRCSGSSRGVPPTRAQSRRPGLPPRGGCCDVRSVSEGSPRSGHAHACHCPPCSVRCVCPPPAAPGHGRTWRHRAGILRLRPHPGRGRPAPEASGGPRRGPRGSVHLPLKDLGRAPETVAAGVLTAGTPPGPERGVGGRTGLSPRRRSCSGVHLRGPATRGAGDGGGNDDHRRLPTPVGTLPGPGWPQGCQRRPVPSHKTRRSPVARSGCEARGRRHARVVRPAPRPSRGEGTDA